MITTIINFCTTDWRCIGRCIEEAKKYSSQILIPVCDHFFNGEKEDQLLLEAIFRKHQDVQFIFFPYLKDRFYYRYLQFSLDNPNWIMYWYSTPRYIAYFYVHSDCEAIHFVDSDEIFDGDQMKKFIESPNFHNYDAFRFDLYYYFREARFRAKEIVKGGLLAKKRTLTPEKIFNLHDRYGIMEAIEGKVLKNLRGDDDLPMAHHYSWVRTKEECLKKTCSWGHRDEKPWNDLIEEEFSRPFNGKDFLLGLEYDEIKPEFDPFSVTEAEYPKQPSSEEFFHVRKVVEQDIFLKHLESEFS